jgi:hypothetical protein
MRRFLSLLLVGLFAVAPASAQRPVALVGPTAIDPADSTVIEDATIVWEGEELVAVGPSDKVAVPPGAAVTVGVAGGVGSVVLPRSPQNRSLRYL